MSEIDLLRTSVASYDEVLRQQLAVLEELAACTERFEMCRQAGTEVLAHIHQLRKLDAACSDLTLLIDCAASAVLGEDASTTR